MNIWVERSGGFAGLKERIASVNTAELDSAAAERLEKLVESIGFFNLPAALPGAVGADLFQYDLTVVDGPRRHTVAFVEDDTPQTGALRSIVQQLTSGSF